MKFLKVEALCSHASSSNYVNIPSINTTVYRDECAYCCRTCKHCTGIFICMTCFSGLCESHITKHTELNSSHVLYTQICEICDLPEHPKQEEEVFELKNLGVVKSKKFNTNVCCSVCSLCFLEIPETLRECYEAIINSSLPRVQDAKSGHENDLEWQKESCIHLKELNQISYFSEDSSKTEQPENKCSVADCGSASNNWMCMTCGIVSCPRREVGGQGHALQHFAETGHPCAVKLGTITISGADIYCYACDDDCYDDNFMKHMAHFGIDITTAKKTAKSMSELEYDYSSQYDFNKLTEADVQLVPAYGPGRTGIVNIGNSCYIASVLQAFFALSCFKEAFYFNRKCHHQERCEKNPYMCHHCQIERIAAGLLSGEFSMESNSRDHDMSEIEKKSHENGISPRLFKNAFARESTDFMSNEQQDAQEYLSYMIEQLERHIYFTDANMHPAEVFYFLTEHRMECGNCHHASSQFEKNLCLQLNISKEVIEMKSGFDNRSEEQHVGETSNAVEVSRPRCSLEDCLAWTLGLNQEMECRCEKCNKVTHHYRQTFFNTCPEILVIALQRTYYDFASMSAKKMDVFVNVPEAIDLNMFVKSNNLETEYEPKLTSWQNESEHTVSTSHKLDISAQLPIYDDAALMILVNMGIEIEIASYALAKAKMNVDEAIEYIFSHPDIQEEVNRRNTTQEVRSSNKFEVLTNGSGEYEMSAMISHMGSSAKTGHYVCHVKEDVTNKWLLFNDEKVGFSHDPPFAMASTYFFKRKKPLTE